MMIDNTQMILQTEEARCEALKKIRHIALDMDGTIYNGNTLFPFTIPFLAKLKRWGIGYSFLTNNPTKSASDYVQHLRELNIPVELENMYTSAQATIDYLHLHHPEYKRLFILGTPSMIAEFESAGFISTSESANDVPDAVIVSFDKSLVYDRLCRAAWWIQQQLPYIATNPDKVCPTDQPTVLVDCGSLISCLEYATNRRPDVIIGKPDPRMLYCIMERLNLRADEVAMIGDRIYTDVKTALNAKSMGILVLSGETTMDVVRQSVEKPTLIAQDLSEIEKWLSVVHQ
ncbi:MAG: HAD-IIA family hydrolase [Bacteroidales bacterium]|nr:HAD-IIA family hydrolase [Bacteroidales bacterium]